MCASLPGSRCTHLKGLTIAPGQSAGYRSARPCHAWKAWTGAGRRSRCRSRGTQRISADGGQEPPTSSSNSTTRRRQLLLGAALTYASGMPLADERRKDCTTMCQRRGNAVGIPVSPEAQATKQVSVEGEDLEAFEILLYLDVVALKGSVPPQWVEDFQQALGPYGDLKLHQKRQLQDIYHELGAAGTTKKGWFGKKQQRNVPAADAVTVGDSWLAPAIKAGYLQPLQDVTSYRWWDALSPRWRKLITRDASGQLDSQGQVWGVPYRWGCNLVAYSPKHLCRRGGTPIQDWADLLQPRLEGRLGFLDSPREFIGVALKTLGLPFNCSYAQLTKSTVSMQQVRARVKHLRQQVRLFSNEEHTRAMTANDVWAIVGSSQDLLPFALRSSAVTLVAPVSGVALWADLWTIPRDASGGSEGFGPSPLLPAWFEFGLMPSRVQPSRGLQQGASPLQLPSMSVSSAVMDSLAEQAELLNGLMPEEQTLLRSEFLLPMDKETTAMYNDLLTM